MSAVPSRVGSPCIGVCRMDESGSGWCLGCLRSLDEIAAWGGLSDAGRRRVWALLPERRARLVARGTLPPEAEADAGATGMPPRATP